MSRPFLTARWQHVCLFTYAVPPALLESHLPAGLELDTREGQVFVSVVAFSFLDTRVLGIRWPGHCNFAELNLRFYVRRGGERGVVFLREFVPQRLTCWLARWLYNEPYEAAPITHTITETADAVTAECRLLRARRPQTLAVTGRKPAVRPAADSVEHFFKEHQWGFGRDRRGNLIRYEVQHPCWDVYPVIRHQLGFDFDSVYGPDWAFLNDREPDSVILAVGSEIAVFPKGGCCVSARQASE